MGRSATVKATRTSFRILHALAASGGSGVTDLARRLDLSKGAVHKHLATLSELGYVASEGDTYHLSLRFLDIGSKARMRWEIFDVGTPSVKQLARITRRTAGLVVPEDDRAVSILVETESGRPPAELAEGRSTPFHATAGGKAILAFLDSERRADVLADADLASFTPQTVTDRATLEAELERVRERRYAFENEEFIEGWKSVAGVVSGPDGSSVGAVCVGGPAEELSGKTLEEDLAGQVVSTARSIQNDLLSD